MLNSNISIFQVILTIADSSSHNLQLDRSFDDSTEARGLQPVQGQKRSTVDKRSRKLPKPIPEPKGTNCKQQ